MTPIRFIDTPPALNQAVIGVCFVTNQSQVIQLLISADCLLDLSAVERKIGGRLLTVHQSLKPLELEIGGQTAHCGNLVSAPTFIDQRLNQQLQWAVTTDLGWVELTPSDVLQHMPRHAPQPFSVPVALLDPDQSDDVDQLFANIESLTGRRIKKRLDETLELPTLPHTATEIIRLKLDPNAGLDELAEVVETDPP